MGEVSNLKYFLCGGFGGICTVIVGHPLDTIKVHLQTMPVEALKTPKYSGTFDCAKQIVRAEGFRGLYKGMAAPLGTKVYFTLYPDQHDRIINIILYPKNTKNLIECLSAGYQIKIPNNLNFSWSFANFCNFIFRLRLRPNNYSTRFQSLSIVAGDFFSRLVFRHFYHCDHVSRWTN